MPVKRKTRKQKAGKKIGEGSFGKVYRPPLLCSKPAPQFDSDEYISKVLAYEDIEKEMGASVILNGLDRAGDWSIRVLHVCKLGVKQTDTNFTGAASDNFQVIYKYGGLDFNNLILSPDGVAREAEFYKCIYDSEMWSRLSKDGFSLIVRLIKELLPQIRKMNEEMYHCDMHFGNIVYDGHKPRLIDFGLYKTRANQLAHIRRSWETRYIDYGVTEDRMRRVMEDLEPVIENDALTTDVGTLYNHLDSIINSPWGKSVFKNEFKYWRIANMGRKHTYDEFYSAIMDIPS
jgi:hypothetical protein